MPKISNSARKKFSSLLLYIRKAREINQDQLEAAETDAEVVAILQAGLVLDEQLAETIKLEKEYRSSEIGITDAENGLALVVRDARKTLSNLNTVAKYINAIAEMTAILARLAALL